MNFLSPSKHGRRLRFGVVTFLTNIISSKAPKKMWDQLNFKKIRSKKKFGPKHFFGLNFFFRTTNFFRPKKIFRPKIFLNKDYFPTKKISWTKIYISDQNKIRTKRIFGPKSYP